MAPIDFDLIFETNLISLKMTVGPKMVEVAINHFHPH